jgi:hypothetical protein
MSADPVLNAEQREDLRLIAGIIIPASSEFGVPGADDPAIQANMLATIGRDAVLVREALGELARIAGAPLASLDPEWQVKAALELRARGTAAVSTLIRVILQCYYRNDRVVRSLGLEPRPPYPKGYVLEDGDWSLLNQVRMRPSFWRQA